ncbi:MAG TPA: hypothetical protein VFF98_10680, partial [Novosphingobium sp.]|nr:hypothetical protein [Novosphingobium sp.]
SALTPAAASLPAQINAAMAQSAIRAAPYRRARRAIVRAIGQIGDRRLAAATRAALLQPGDCLRHRTGLSRADEEAIVARLRTAGFLTPELAPEAAREGLFPPVLAAGSACPHLAVPVLAAAGGNSRSHHSWPGGLAIHTAENLALGSRLARAYPGLPQPAQDGWRAAILWHDWAKALVLPWQADGLTRPELQIAGTGAHHILGLAEAMRRGLPGPVIAAQACAHALPGTDGAPVAGWLQAAAIIARRPTTQVPTARPGPACRITFAADQSWPRTDAALARAEVRLRALAQPCGRDSGPAFEIGVKNALLARQGTALKAGRSLRPCPSTRATPEPHGYLPPTPLSSFGA